MYSQCTGVRYPTELRQAHTTCHASKLSKDYNYLMSIEKATTRGPTLSIDRSELVREVEEADSNEDGRGEGKVVLGAGQLRNADRERLAR
ncbi:hypothetical protein L211DRAFT_842389, partial [Terfezia boudieri ATCC MYA-4762]